MSLAIERLAIRGLHHARDYNIPIRENKIVMVGVNGLGKTTVVNLLYLILSRQWDRTLDYEFDSIEITINGDSYHLTREESGESVHDVARRMRVFLLRMAPQSAHTPAGVELYERFADTMLKRGRDALAAEMDRLLPIPSATCRRFAGEFQFQQESYNRESLDRLDATLKEYAGSYQVLYLPTYRRIEKEFSLLFPDFEESIHSFQRRKGVMQGENRRAFIELVEFGMEDVDSTFHRVQSELVATARSELNGLAGGYLRDVIRGEGEDYQTDTFLNLDDSTIDRILNRAEERTLDETDKTRLRAVIEKLKNPPGTGLKAVDRYIAHFFSKLINVDRALSEKEQVIKRFTDVCNRYLAGKRIAYDDKDSSLSVRLVPSGKPLSLKSLSSGEKQIVSLFSHLYLRERGRVLVIIDEPELSLSVTWQQQLLPDILDTGKCDFLAAVTHSPFIFQNALDPYAVNLIDCISEAKR